MMSMSLIRLERESPRPPESSGMGMPGNAARRRNEADATRRIKGYESYDPKA
jgi:hypothetical protein